MRKEFYICVIAAITLFSIFTVGSATTFEVPLAARGSYITNQETPFEFDLGVMLSDVNEVKFVCDGFITAGVSYFGDPFSWLFSAYLNAGTGYMSADGPWAGEDTYPSPEPFSGQSQFSPLLGGTWDFLLDGHATGRVTFPAVLYIPEFPPRADPFGYLNYASIIINAYLIGDFDANGDVDSVDFAIFALAWGSSPGDENWNPRCDISDPNDNVIDKLDLGTFTYNWLAGKYPGCEPPPPPPPPVCMKETAPEYPEWDAWGKPKCWCYVRQCRGDSDGIKTGPFWVAIPDLNAFRTAFNKTDVVLQTVTNGICSDLDHIKTGPFRIAIPDLNNFRLYFNKPELQVPECPSGNYNFWANP